MTIEECGNRNRAVMRNAIEWANGKECMELYILDIFIISEYLDIKIPTCFELVLRIILLQQKI